MDQMNHATDWIGAYLEWTHGEWMANAASSSARFAMTATNGDFPAAYLEWLDATAQVQRHRASNPGRRAADIIGNATGFREAVLLAALHTESDCLHILRQTLDGGTTSPGTVSLAVEVLEHAHRLLDDERLAWHALSALGGSGRRRASDAWRTGFEADWPHALEDVAADVRALTGKVLALQVH